MARKNENLITRNEQIGQGGFGTVYIGSYRDHKEVGIKDVKGKLSAEALAEANLLKTLTHPHIIQYIDIVQTPNQTSIIMEFIDGGCLFEYIRRTTQSLMYWKVTRQIMIDVAHGMAYLHSQRIVHADLKSLNVLLRHNHSAVICDFGLARTIADSRAVTTCSVRVQELTAISDVDIHNINQGKEKSLSSNSSHTRPSTGNKRSPIKASLSSPKVNDTNSDEYVTAMTQLKLGNPDRKRKSSTVRRTDDSTDKSTIEADEMYDFTIGRHLYKGPRGGWYYLTPNGSKAYIKTD
ncbi:unnamed protein product [Rotaria sp. Silwood2]|nr:unnamed protein product [Rotaria sp. Silwood2]CAF4448002.1 unnamed protein product [Rotaria sp. Silwood2]